MKTVIKGLIGLMVGAFFNHYIWLMASGLSGAGHGVYSPYSLAGSPLGVFCYLWPIAIASTAIQTRRFAFLALALIGCHCLSVVVNYSLVLRIIKDYSNLDSEMRLFMLRFLAIYLVALMLIVITNIVTLAPAKKISATRR
jgi:hypothetical protein